jgi:hypothetical protein
MQTWEYMRISVPIGGIDSRTMNTLASLGRSGWELVAYVQEQSSTNAGGSRYAGTLLLKRPTP